MDTGRAFSLGRLKMLKIVLFLKSQMISSSPLKVRDNLLQDRPELFMKDNTVNRDVSTSLHPYKTQVRPGILVLVNDSDWELLGELEYVVQVS